MKINIEFDTVTKKLVATMDGAAIADISEINVCKCWCPDDSEEEFAIQVRTSAQDKVNKTRTQNTVYASHAQKIKTNLLKDFK